MVPTNNIIQLRLIRTTGWRCQRRLFRLQGLRITD